MTAFNTSSRRLALAACAVGIFVAALPAGRGAADTILSDGRTLSERMLVIGELLDSGENAEALVEAKLLGRELGSVPAVLEIQERAVFNLLEEVRSAIAGAEAPSRKAARRALQRLQRIEAVVGTRPELSFLKARANWLLGDYRAEVTELDSWLEVAVSSHPDRHCVETARMRAKAAIEQGERFSREIGHSPSPIAEGKRGWSDLHYAAALDLHEVIAVLLAGPTTCNKSKKAARIGYVSVRSETYGVTEIAKRILTARKALPVHADEDLRSFPLAIAAMANAPGAASTLLGHGAPVNPEETRYGWENRNSPLYWVVLGNRLGFARLLVERGADIYGENSAHPPPLLVAVQKAHFELAAQFLNREIDIDYQQRRFAQRTVLQQSLIAAAEGDHVELAELLLDCGVDVNHGGSKYFSDDKPRPLFVAVERNHVDLAALFLDRGAEVNFVEHSHVSEGRSLLSSAVQPDKTEMAKLLVDRGAEFGPEDLLRAIRARGWEIAEFLIGRGVDVNGAAMGRVKTWSGLDRAPVLHILIAANDLEGARFLLDRNADVNVRDWLKRTALHVAAAWENLDAARLLIDHGADIDAIDTHGSAPLHSAVVHEAAELARLFVERGADTNVRDGRGRTPAEIARSEGNEVLAIEVGASAVLVKDRG